MNPMHKCAMWKYVGDQDSELLVDKPPKEEGGGGGGGGGGSRVKVRDKKEMREELRRLTAKQRFYWARARARRVSGRALGGGDGRAPPRIQPRF